MTSNPQKRKPKHKRGRKKTKKIKDAESPVNSPPPESSGSSEHGNEDGLLAERDTEEEATSGSSEEEAAGYRMLSEAEKEGSEGMQEEKEDEEGYSGSGEEHDDGQESSDRENDGQQRSNRFAEGSNAFRSAFSKIMGKKVSDDSLGPVLSAHKKLIARKLDEEAGERKVKNEAKKEKRLLREKGHVQPESFLDGKEKVLIRLATKGVVKLFNAVNKAQNVQSSHDISKSRGAKAVRKETKAAFLSELRGASLPCSFNPAQFSSVKAHSSSVMETKNELQNSVSKPGWAALHDDFMLTSSKVKDWDRLPDASAVDVIDGMQVVNNGSSSSDED